MHAQSYTTFLLFHTMIYSWLFYFFKLRPQHTLLWLNTNLRSLQQLLKWLLIDGRLWRLAQRFAWLNDRKYVFLMLGLYSDWPNFNWQQCHPFRCGCTACGPIYYAQHCIFLYDAGRTTSYPLICWLCCYCND